MPVSSFRCMLLAVMYGTVLRLRSGGSRIAYAAVEGVEFIDLLFRDQCFSLI